MTRLLILTGAATFVGFSLALSELRWFRRPGLATRLSPYAAGVVSSDSAGVFSVASFREVVAPLAQALGARAAQLFGVSEELSVRLSRIHSPIDATAYRVRQMGWVGATLALATLASAGLRLAPLLAILATVGLPALAFLALEQRVASASEDWQRRLFLELPVIAEQLAMLTTAGWSLGAALQRLGTRGTGACAADLRRVSQRIRQGLSEADALREWAERADVEALNRLVSVLALDREATDLGRLIAQEAQSIRRESQRQLIETIETRNQQVWIPVTVAALVPGVLLMGIPFLDALTLFSSS